MSERRRLSDAHTPAVLPLDEHPGPAVRLSPAAADLLLTDVLAAAAARPTPTRPLALAPPQMSSALFLRRNSWIRRPLAFAAMMGFLVSGLSAAAYVAGRRLGLITVDEAPAPAPAPEPARAAPIAPRAAPRKLRPAPPTARPAARPAPVAKPAPAPVGDPLAMANDLRRRGAWALAARAYARVADGSDGPGAGTAAARTAALATAALDLEHLGHPEAALGRYQALLRAPLPEPLNEEARWGIAECYHRLGNRDGEASALRALLAAHPGGLLRARAESRLASVGGARPATAGTPPVSAPAEAPR